MGLPRVEDPCFSQPAAASREPAALPSRWPPCCGGRCMKPPPACPKGRWTSSLCAVCLRVPALKSRPGGRRAPRQAPSSRRGQPGAPHMPGTRLAAPLASTLRGARARQSRSESSRAALGLALAIKSLACWVAMVSQPLGPAHLATGTRGGDAGAGAPATQSCSESWPCRARQAAALVSQMAGKKKKKIEFSLFKSRCLADFFVFTRG